MTIDFTGEFFVPGKSGQRIEADHMERYKFACRFVQGKSVLDIACGAGYAAPLLIEAGAASYDGVDINQLLVEHANETYGTDSISYHLGDICTFNNGAKYDAIICYETIEHVANYESAVHNLCSLLHHGGLVLISSPNRPVTSPSCSSLEEKPENEFHTQEFIPSELSSILQKHGFTTDQRDVFGQRQRYSNRFLKNAAQIVSGNPDTKASPALTQISPHKTPRYFVILATKR